MASVRGENGGKMNEPKSYLIEIAGQMPDVIYERALQEVVRCRDCQHARHYHPLNLRTGKPCEKYEEWFCDWHSNAEGASEVEPDGFCAWGERKDDSDDL